MPESPELPILGLGNVLLGGDGLGAAAVAELERNYVDPARRELARVKVL